jgi:bla regulator protein BlaR1
MPAYIYSLLSLLGYGLLHTLWQGAVLFVLLKLLLGLIRQRRPDLRYLVMYGTMCLFCACLFFNMFWLGSRFSLDVARPDAAITTVMAVSDKDISNPPFSANGVLSAIVPWVALGYLLTVIVLTARTVIYLGRVYWLRRGLEPVDRFIEEQFQRLCNALVPGKKVGIFLSANISSPMVTGIFKPIVLLPLQITTSLDAVQLEAILIHELHHIARRDFLFNLLQSVMETLLFFHPFSWWLSSEIRKEREFCCDDYVVARTGDPLRYAKALFMLEEQRQHRGLQAVMASGPNHTTLLTRIKRITTMKNEQMKSSGVWAFGATILGAALFCITAVAQDTNTAKKEDAVKQEQKAQGTTSRSFKHKKVVITDANGKTKVYEEAVGDTTGHAETLKLAEEAMMEAKKALLSVDMKETRKALEEARRKLDEAVLDISVLDPKKLRAETASAVAAIDDEDLRKSVRASVDKIGDITRDQVQSALETARKALESVQLEELMKEAFDQLDQASEDLGTGRWTERFDSLHQASALKMKEAKQLRQALAAERNAYLKEKEKERIAFYDSLMLSRKAIMETMNKKREEMLSARAASLSEVQAKREEARAKMEERRKAKAGFPQVTVH